ncbi:putative cytochrome C-553 [Haemophilus pittmaniae HK 85]|jgi:cytochrome c-553|uniref:Cytochrome c553 n=2 Tax=Haemophilus pittmaniae TaxID=249188 RepID=A0A377J0D7_9PAST|nr:c-type cytochrome [Haemophilus pittmaniae]EGV07622.1 putative cytochrome C-553 [Haemophilus pittmaniae HK 85]MBS6026228.1 c-type cytochrome [Haemophilus pittmaniae]SNV83212.1 Cytochrome c553 [Haemophilus pittmaniae]STO93708.1 Cytochrome c553 [Haemophilus pittmaniae]
MKKSIYFLLIGLFGISISAHAEIDMSKAEKLYKRSCATCHGKQAEKAAMGESRHINQLDSATISKSLTERRDGVVAGGVGNPAKNRLTDEDIRALSEYIPQLKSK